MGNAHEATKEVRDPVYGFVKLSEAEWDIINSPEFGRLRDIRQLGMGHLVYPGANHTRFEHSIGTLHLSSLMFDTLIVQDQDIIAGEFALPAGAQDRARQVLRLASLLHDVGHAPFSHSGEDLLPIVAAPKPDRLGADQPKRMTHEDLSAQIIRETGIAGILEDRFGPQGITLDEVVAVATDFRLAPGFRSQTFHGLLHDLLTGELGADRIDYLLRDAHHSGQKSGDFDYGRLVGNLRLVPPLKEAEPGHRIGFDAGGWLVAEQMIVARYLMYQSLYFHKTKRILEIHLEHFMREWLRARYDRPELPADLAKYLAISDSTVWADIRAAALDARNAGHEHAKRLVGRGQMRLAKELILADNCLPTSSGRRIPAKKRFDKLRNDVRITFGNKVICDEPDHSATKMFDDTTKILVLLDNEPRYLDDISEIVRGMSDKIWRGRVYSEKSTIEEVHAWCDDWLGKHPVAGFGEAQSAGS